MKNWKLILAFATITSTFSFLLMANDSGIDDAGPSEYLYLLICEITIIVVSLFLRYVFKINKRDLVIANIFPISAFTFLSIRNFENSLPAVIGVAFALILMTAFGYLAHRFWKKS